MRLLVLGGVLALGGCGGGGTTGTNYADTPPMAEIVATPSPKASETPVTEATPEAANDSAGENVAETQTAAEAAADVEAPANAAE
ncbi:hypothetical protein [Sphingomonas sp. LM7]|uniref:hypothetical protein n=1 Tax=Sphingomonas sp. LM7 TaxID=1938607 RepID=UPI00098405A0|nr:hypothetical protein [Sphingomonas sp. LM7]AQR72466.1 hypothetical protein BXU08_01200 [Sphingomonas sp. LM7]